MKIIKPDQNSILLNTFAVEAKQYMSVTVLLGFDLSNPNKLITEQELWDTVKEVLGDRAVPDQGMPKFKGEVLVAGFCHAPENETRTESFVRFRVGDIRKEISVFGDRHWKKKVYIFSKATDPEPFTKMAVSWENAFGGNGYKHNPTGKGYSPIIAEGGQKLHPLPNIELHRSPIVSPGDRPQPAGFSPYPAEWPQRRSKLGTYDKKWYQERWPSFPDDMDYGYFNIAPLDQQAEGYFNGDEVVEIFNMHPTTQHIVSRLPGKRIRCFKTAIIDLESDPEETEFEEIAMNLDTVWLFPSVLRGLVACHGKTPVHDDEFNDVERLYISMQNLADEPKTLEACRYEEKIKRVQTEELDESDFEEADKKLAEAEKEIAGIPRRIEEEMAALSEDTPASTKNPMNLMKCIGVISSSNDMLADIETSLGELKKEFGHMVKIDTKEFMDARKDLQDASTEFADSVEKAKRNKDRLKQQIDSSQPGMENLETAFMEDEENPWHECGFELLKECAQKIEEQADILEQLKSNGLTADIIEQARLGLNDRERIYDPSEWGLGPDDVENKHIILPPGLVMPHFSGEIIDRIIVRPLHLESGNKYSYIYDFSRDRKVEGSVDTPLFLGYGDHKPIVIVPDELHAWLVYQEAWDLCRVIALKAPAMPEDEKIKEKIEGAPAFLVVRPETEEPDEADALKKWQEIFQEVEHFTLPYGATVFETHKKGHDIRAWIFDKLPDLDLPPEYDLAGVQAREKEEDPFKKYPVLDATVIGSKFTQAVPRGGLDPMKKMADIKERLKGKGQLTPDIEQKLNDASNKMKGLSDQMAAMFKDTGGGAASSGETANSFAGKNPLEKIVEIKDNLRGKGQLTPEIERKLDDFSTQMKDLPDIDEKQFEEVEKEAGDPFETLSREQVVSMHAGGESLADRNLEGTDLSGLDLRGIDLRQANLQEANFSGTALDGANLTEARCNDADFSKASLKSANMTEGIFINARFAEADMSGSVLKDALMKDADLSKANCSKANMESVILEGADLRQAVLCDAFIQDGMFLKANTQKASFNRADMTRTFFLEARVEEADFSNITSTSMMFWEVTGTGSRFTDAELGDIRIGGRSVFKNADFQKAKMAKASFLNSDLSGSNFKESSLKESMLEDCDLSSTCFYHVEALQTRFNKSNLEGADMKGINLFQGSFRKAMLKGTDLRGANLYGVEFFKAELGDTLFDSANLKKTLLNNRGELSS